MSTIIAFGAGVIVGALGLLFLAACAAMSPDKKR